MITKRTILITVSAIAVAAAIITAIFIMTSGISRSEAENAAAGYVPQGAEYVKSEKDGNVYEVTYRDNGLGRSYEVDIDRETGEVVGISMDSDRDHGGASAAITAEQAEAAVRDEISNIKSVKVYKETDDDGIYYDVEFTAGDFYGSAEVNAETGAVTGYNIRYGAPVVIPSSGSGQTQTDVKSESSSQTKDDNADDKNKDAASSSSGTSQSSSGSTQTSGQTSSGSSQSSGQTSSQQPSTGTQKPSGGTSQSGGGTSQLISADKAKSIVLSKIGHNSAVITGLELDRDDGIYQYEGEAYYGGYEYDFEINASSGVIIKWEVDREDWD